MKVSIKDMTLVSIFTALTAVGAFISIPLGPVPITLQSFFVLLSGMILGPNLAALSQVLYIVLALIGLPIFSNFSGGLQIIFKPSFGFAVGFILAAYIIGIMCQYGKSFLGTIIASIIIYLMGLPYMYYILNLVMGQKLPLAHIIKVGCLLFLPGDLLKLVLANLVYKRISALVDHIRAT